MGREINGRMIQKSLMRFLINNKQSQVWEKKTLLPVLLLVHPAVLPGKPLFNLGLFLLIMKMAAMDLGTSMHTYCFFIPSFLSK